MEDKKGQGSELPTYSIAKFRDMWEHDQPPEFITFLRSLSDEQYRQLLVFLLKGPGVQPGVKRGEDTRSDDRSETRDPYYLWGIGWCGWAF